MRALVLLLLLGACASAPSYRNASAPIASAAMFESARFAGTWHEVATYPGPDACLGATETWAPRGDGTFAVLRQCRGVWTEGIATVTGPGRMVVTKPGAEPQPVWVLWVDQDYRTAVLGQPSGRRGRILNRSPQIPADRMAAAREILAFNGYDVTRLLTTAPAEAAQGAPAGSRLGAAAATSANVALTGLRVGTTAAQTAATVGNVIRR